MNRIPLLVLWLLTLISSLAQTKEIDSLWSSYNTENNDSNKVKTLYLLSNAYQDFKPDTALLLSWHSVLISRKIKFEKGESWALNQMASAFNKMGNYPRALEYYIKQLKIEEKWNNPEYLANIEMSIATVYQLQKEHKNALIYALKADSIINKNKLEDLKIYNLINLGDIYEKMDQLSPALNNTYKALSMAEVKNLRFLYGPCLNNLGNIYSKQNNSISAFDNYRQGLPYLIETANEDFLCESYLGMAKLYKKENRIDSAEYFGRLSFLIAEKDSFNNRMLDAALLMKDLFKQQGHIDSAYHYQEKVLHAKETIFSKDKIRDALNISSEEQLRQAELSNERMQEKFDRKKKLQLLSIALFLPVLFLFTMYLNKKKVKPRYVEFAGILSLLLAFEYISILIHPFVMEKTSHTPILELMIFAVIAATLTPLHHRIENWMLMRLSHKSKKSLAK
jgi:tetratricopeptide (TPR) repeat protein